MDEIQQLLTAIYGHETAAAIRPRLDGLIDHYRHLIQPRSTSYYFDQGDAVLITYGDMVQRPGEPPLRTLSRFLNGHLKDVVSCVHLLPFYPYSSDDGFSVIDYYAVDAALGTWNDVAEIGRAFRLMFDAVVNHISAQSHWFQSFLRDEPPYCDYFTTVEPAADLSTVFRPRARPLLTEVETTAGPRHVWSTFSPDQIDLNYANPDVLLAIIDVLLFYVVKGAELLRLDAIAFMWKEIDTRCLHLPQTHQIIQLWRRILDDVAPQVALITETNVPHQENISYFGDGSNEAQMVYNFSLPPLTLHAFHTGNAETLSEWAGTLTLPSNRVTFFNFLASHDGIGLVPARGLLSETAVAAMAERVQRLGGHVSYRHNPDGTQSAYELNINYLDALADPQQPAADPALMANRFLAAQAIMLSLRGVPGVYFHSLFGSRGWPEGVQPGGQARTINRQKVPVQQIEAELMRDGSLRRRVFAGYSHLLRTRARSAAFHPHGAQEIHRLHPAVFALQRTAPDGTESVLCLHNVSAVEARVALPTGKFSDMLSGITYAGPTAVTLVPYQVRWLYEEQ